MRKFILLFIISIISMTGFGQDFSNKGREFWLAYCYHVGMVNSGGTPVMTVYITSDVTTAFTVEIYGGATIATGTVVANSVVPVVIPNTYFINNDGLFTGRTVHITGVKPIVVYSFITRSAASAATLCLPTNVLGKQYYSANFTQVSNEANSSGFITIVAVEDNTSVEIIPTGATKGGWAAGSVNVVNLNKGEIYQVLGVAGTNGGTSYGADLTGTSIRSISSGTSGCKRIAVYSGTGKINIDCPSGSADNLYQQLYPYATWGKRYMTVPSANRLYNPYRIIRPDPTANVYLNGTLISPLSFTNNFYDFANNTPNLITSDVPICVVEYFTSAASGASCPLTLGNPNPYDPDMVIINPVEQNISNVTLVNSPLTAAGGQIQNIQVIIKNTGTALSSFLFDGFPVPIGSWITHPQDPTYSYLYETGIAQGNHTLKSDSGFNALAYGYGQAESYAYSAGANVKDLYTSTGTATQYGIEAGAACQGTPVKFKISLPYQPDSIYWDLSGIVNTPQYGIEKLLPIFPATSLVPDSITTVNGKSVYWYSLPNQYSFSSSGSYTIPITLFSLNADGCGNQQELDMSLDISPPPGTNFTWITGGCPAIPVQFTDITVSEKPAYIWWWDFGDNTFGNTANPTHTYAAPGTYNVRFVNITTSGCISDTIVHQVVIPDLPTATISASVAACINAPSPSLTFTITGGVPPYQIDYSINGVAQPTVISAANTYTISGIPTNVAGVFTYSLDSIKNQGSTVCKRIITGQTATVTINPYATINLQGASSTQTVCVNTPITDIKYTIVGGTGGVVNSGTLPPGLTTAYGAGVFTITGTPTASGTYTFSVLPVATCVDPASAVSYTLVVSANATLSLDPASASTTQTVCINNNIGNIVYNVGGGATGATVVFTPPLPGVTGTYNAATSQFTILGTPTATAFPYTYSYAVATVSTCQNPPPATGTITVNPNATLALDPASPGSPNQTLCVNNAITEIDYIITGSVTSVTVAPLPTGITYLYTPGVAGGPGSLKITGTPTSPTAGVLNYTITVLGNCQVPPQLSGSFNVTDNAAITLAPGSGPASQTLCVNTALSTINYNITGAVTSVTVTGLPAGVTYSYTPGTPGILSIVGTPTGAGSTYNINLFGPCQVPPAPAATGTITVTPDATISFSSTPSTRNQAVCVNTPIATINYTLGGSATGATITGLPPGVTGTVSGNLVTILGIPTVVSTTPVVYTYHVKATGPCVDPDSTGTITVNPDHVLNIPANEHQTVCSGIQITPIIYSFAGGATGVTITGLPANGITYTVAGNVVTIQGAATGSVNYTIKTVGNGCQLAQSSGTIAVIPLPTPNFNFTTPSCDTRVITFTDASVANAGTITGWAWNFGDGNTATGNPVTHIYAGTGTYNVTLTVTTSNSCSNAAPFVRQVTITARPHADFTVPASSCVNDVVQFTDASTGTLSASGYKWDFGDIASGAANTQTTVNGTHQFSAAGATYTVTHIVTTTSGCTDTTTHNIFISSAPVSDFSVTNAGTLCSNDSVAIVNLSTIAAGNISKLEVYWDYLNAPGTFDVDLAPTVNKVYKHKYSTFQAPLNKPYTVRVVTYSGLSCASIKSTIINVNATPKVQFNAMPDACYTAAPFQITQASEIGGVPGNGVYSGPGVSPTGLFSPVLAGIGTFTLKYTYTSAFGCMDTMSQTIKVLDTASAVFSHLVPLCEGNAATFIEQSAAPAGVTLTNTTWTFGDGSPLETHAPGTTFTHNYPGAGSYTVTEYNTSSNSCRSTNNVQVVVVNPNPVPAFAFDQTTACLPNAGITFQNTSSIPGTSAITYLWDFGDGKTSTARIPPAHIYNTTGPFTVTLKVTSDSGCIKSASRLINFIHPQPIAAFDFNKPDVCIGGDVIVTDKTDGLDGTVTEWHWDFGDGITASTKQVQHLYTTAQTYNVELYIVNSQGCASTVLSQPFMVNPYPVVDAGPDRVVLEGGAVTMQPVVTGFNLQYLWSPATYLSSTTDATPTASGILNDITYTLTVTGRGGCVAPSDNVFIKVLRAPKIPNTFTPNGDGINEKWLIDYLDTYPDCRVQVFTRTGQSVFESKGYKIPWDGTLNGKPLPFDTYYYIIEPGNGRAPITGYVTIIK